MGRCGRRTARRATHPRTASQAGDALIDQTSGLADHYEEERCHELISVLLSPVSRTASRHAAICMPFFHHTSLAHTSHHAQPRAIASASHARASGMHTPTRQPHTPCGPSVCACPASCVRLCVMSTSYLPPHGVTPPPGVKISERSKQPLRLKKATNIATKAPPLRTHGATTAHPQRLRSACMRHTNRPLLFVCCMRVRALLALTQRCRFVFRERV